MRNNKIKLFLVDDDIVFLKSLEAQFLKHTDFIIETYETGEICIEHLSHKPDIIILDYYLNGIDTNAINGIDTLDKIKLTLPNIPVIMLSSQDKIEIAINCMHHSAHDYIVKNETSFIRLQKIISTIYMFKKIENELEWYMKRM